MIKIIAFNFLPVFQSSEGNSCVFSFYWFWFCHNNSTRNKKSPTYITYWYYWFIIDFYITLHSCVCCYGWCCAIYSTWYTKSNFWSDANILSFDIIIWKSLYFIKVTPRGIWFTIIIDLGDIASLTSVSLVSLLGQSRVFYSMAHDSLSSGIFAEVQPRTKTTWISTIIVGKNSRLFLSIKFLIMLFI